ncbi:MAG: S8 family serine peptidase [Deltaproteobacteria bacterium]|nr:S8 family serine peptidase [Deltaproteobacteria bacterium]
MVLAFALVMLAAPSAAPIGTSVASPSSPLPSTSARATPAPPKRVVPAHVLVKLADVGAKTLRAADAGDAVARAHVVRALRSLDRDARTPLAYSRALPLGWALVRAPGLDEASTEALVARLAKAPGVLAAAPDKWNRALRTTDDEYLSYQWDVDAIGAKGAWDITQGKTSQRVAVLDSGTFLGHPELSGKDANGWDFVDNSEFSNDGDGRDADYDDPGDGNCQGSGEPDSFHGTHVAGTILANTDNGSGIAGLNWHAQLITVRSLAQCGGSDVDIMEGLAWLGGEPIGGVPALPAADRPSVVNMSLGGPSACSQFNEDVLAFVVGQGIVPIIAAGNDAGPVNSPANCPSAVAVAAFGPSGDVASYSSFGSEIDIVGPGGDQDATGIDADGVLSLYATVINPPYVYYQGTSMAAPHVAGVVALMQAIDASIGRAEVLAAFAAVNAGSCSGCSGKPVLRADLLVAEVGGSVTTEPGDPCVGGVCSGGQSCVEDVCRADCVDDGDCGANERCAGGACVPDGGGGGGGTGLCDEARGNMDCPSGSGCVDGVCEEGEDDGANVGALCERDRDCATGLCELGVCTVTCDFDDGDCKDGFDCDDDRVPGGLCVPESCKEEDEDFCERDWSCHFSPTDNYVCAYGEPNYGCNHSTPSRRSPVELVALLVVPLVGRRRRRR